MMPTLTDDLELEEARLRSIPSNPAPRSATPASQRGAMLSLVNARAPSVVPPAPGTTTMPPTEHDAAWDEFEKPTAPPPPDALALLARSPEQEMSDRLALGDFSGALGLAQALLADKPGHPAALEAAETCRDVLGKMYRARIGSLDRVPTVTVARDQMRWLSIDHRAGFVLSLVDGVSTVEMILDVSGMPELDALRILSELVQQRIITFR